MWAYRHPVLALNHRGNGQSPGTAGGRRRQQPPTNHEALDRSRGPWPIAWPLTDRAAPDQSRGPWPIARPGITTTSTNEAGRQSRRQQPLLGCEWWTPRPLFPTRGGHLDGRGGWAGGLGEGRGLCSVTSRPGDRRHRTNWMRRASLPSGLAVGAASRHFPGGACLRGGALGALMSKASGPSITPHHQEGTSCRHSFASPPHTPTHIMKLATSFPRWCKTQT